MECYCCKNESEAICCYCDGDICLDCSFDIYEEGSIKVGRCCVMSSICCMCEEEVVKEIYICRLCENDFCFSCAKNINYKCYIDERTGCDCDLKLMEI